MAAGDYAATASSIYDPQAASETTQAAAARDASVSALDTQDKAIDPYYKTAEDTLGTAHKANQAKIDFNSSQALDGNASGLTDNAQSAEGSQYIKGLTGLESEDAAKHADVAAQKTTAINNYGAAVSSIMQKYSGMKSGYVADMLNQDSQNAFTKRQADANAALQIKLAGINAAAYTKGQPAAPSTSQLLAKYFTGYQSAKDGGKAFFTERSVIPSLMADSGMSYNDAAKAAYAFRKQNFNE